MAKFKGLRCDLIIDVMWTSYDILPVKLKTIWMHEKKKGKKITKWKSRGLFELPHLVAR